MKAIIALMLFILSSFTCATTPRVVIAGGSLVEIVYALGAGDMVVGVDQTTTYPPQTATLPKVSNWQQLTSEGILSLRPTLLMTWQDANPPQVLNQLAQAGVTVSRFTRTPSTPEQLLSNIRQAGALLNRSDAAEQLVNHLSQQLGAITERLTTRKNRVNVVFLLSVGGGAAQVAGKNTVVDSLITLAGGRNVATHSQYRTYGGEAMIAVNPDVIVVTTQNVVNGVEALAAIPGLVQTSAWKNQRIIALDQAILLGMGPRVAEAVEALNRGFYPD
ncbi:heme/hemin ABC transporter substrate-binding protein [Pectobacterium zantedeschiae]|uniref:heme/hemin ABC transporter substrate-binding protein n=1 Tax=Pectobacterium zantedeschiae TaxID=2034769 RepID=UPI00101C2692|nr:ABC transporter substrate-binding protein [Pectobacterium zantedeschiae]RYC43009.1 hemin ABC transporter substrate-binding protein [Pectobacterium zantedeschiae]